MGFQHVGKFADLLVQFFVGEFLVVGRFVAFPDQGYLVAAFFQVAVKAVVGNIQFAAQEPFQIDFVFAEFPVLHLVPLLEPGDIFLGDAGPELVIVVNGFIIQLLVLFPAFEIRFFAEFFRHRIYAFQSTCISHVTLLLLKVK